MRRPRLFLCLLALAGAIATGATAATSADPGVTSKTILVGEKHIPINKNGVGWWDCSSYNGDYYQCSCRAASTTYGLTTNPNDTTWKFGSRHTMVVLFCFADGHVANVPEFTNPAILELLNQRNDGQVIPSW